VQTKTSPYGSCSWHFFVNPTWFNQLLYIHLRTKSLHRHGIAACSWRFVSEKSKIITDLVERSPADLMDKPFGDGSFDGIQPDKKSLGFWCLATQILDHIYQVYL